MSPQSAIEAVTDHYVSTGLPFLNMLLDVFGVFLCIWGVFKGWELGKRSIDGGISDEEADKMSLKEYLSQKVD